jgi:hypothetical protein
VPEKHGPQHQLFNRSDLLSRRFYSTCRNRPSSTYLHTGIWRVTRIQAAYRGKVHQRQHIAQSRSSYTRKRDRYCRPYCRENLKAGAALSCSFVMLRTAWSGNGRARTVLAVRRRRAPGLLRGLSLTALETAGRSNCSVDSRVFCDNESYPTAPVTPQRP